MSLLDPQDLNILTVDVEDWFHILDLESSPDREGWSNLDSRVLTNTQRLIDLFGTYETKATFFVVGWVAWKHPEVVRAIADAGHEVACHSFWHELVPHHSKESFRADIRAARALLQDLSGQAVDGFRAPGWSIGPEQAWAFEELLEAGFRYDASMVPGKVSHGGYGHKLQQPHRLQCASGELLEIPTPTTRFGPWQVPYSGGGYLRFFPYSFIKRAASKTRKSGGPLVVYVHPREVDIEQPRMRMPFKRRFKYYVGLKGTEAKLGKLLTQHKFTSARAWLDKAKHEDLELMDVREASTQEAHPDPTRIPPLPPTNIIPGVSS